MKALTILSSLVLLAPALSLARQFSIVSDTLYNFNSSAPVKKLACPLSSISPTFVGEGFSTIGEVANALPNWWVTALPKSKFAKGKGCGTCWKLDLPNAVAFFLAIDQAASETNFVASEDFLTGDPVTPENTALLDIKQVDPSKCFE